MRRALFGAGAAAIRQFFQTLALARRNRAAQDALMSAPDWLLDDIGLDRAEVMRRFGGDERKKPRTEAAPGRIAPSPVHQPCT